MHENLPTNPRKKLLPSQPANRLTQIWAPATGNQRVLHEEGTKQPSKGPNRTQVRKKNQEKHCYDW